MQTINSRTSPRRGNSVKSLAHDLISMLFEMCYCALFALLLACIAYWEDEIFALCELIFWRIKGKETMKNTIHESLISKKRECSGTKISTHFYFRTHNYFIFLMLVLNANLFLYLLQFLTLCFTCLTSLFSLNV